MGKKSSFLDYYTSLEATSQKEKKSAFQAVCTADAPVQNPFTSAISEKLVDFISKILFIILKHIVVWS